MNQTQIKTRIMMHEALFSIGLIVFSHRSYRFHMLRSAVILCFLHAALRRLQAFNILHPAGRMRMKT